MFMTKRKYEEAIHKAKMEVTEKWEQKLCNLEKNMWNEQEKCREREDTYRRFDAIEKRISAIEKATGLVRETSCHCGCPHEMVRPY